MRAPRLGAAAVVAAAWSVPVALVLAGVTVFLPASGLTIDVGHLIGACLGRLRAAYGTPAGAGIVTAGQVLTAGMLLRGAWTGVRVVRRRRAERRRHRLLVRWAGAHVPELPAVVLEQAEAAAYAVAGPQRTVVVTRGIVDLLSGPELSAVLAHEHAHLAARHHRWLTAAALVAQALPIVPLLRDAPAGGQAAGDGRRRARRGPPRAAGDRERARRRRHGRLGAARAGHLLRLNGGGARAPDRRLDRPRDRRPRG